MAGLAGNVVALSRETVVIVASYGVVGVLRGLRHLGTQQHRWRPLSKPCRPRAPLFAHAQLG